MSVVAFVGVSVIPMDTERVLPRQTVVVSNGRVVAIGPAAIEPVPAGALRVDGSGKFLMPGLSDAHVHLDGTASLELFVAHGVTTVRNMAGNRLVLDFRDRVARGELFGPTIVTAGPLLDGKDRWWNGSEVVETAADADRVVKAQKDAGYDFVKVYSHLGVEAFEGIASASRRYGLPFAGHVPERVGLDRMLAARPASIEHLTGYLDWVEADDSPGRGKTDRDAWMHRPERADPAKIAAIAAKTCDAGVASSVTLVAHRRFVPLAEAEEWLRAPEMRYVPPLLKASWDPTRDFRLRNAKPEFFDTLRRMDQVNLRITRALHDAGAKLLLGTDEGNPFVAPGASVHLELASLVEAGLRPFEALAAGTRDFARFLGAEAEFGTVAVGRRADLLLLDGNPLERVDNARRLAGVMLRGRWLPKSELDARLEALLASYVPRADRFAGRPALPSEGDMPREAEYVFDFNGVVFAEEHVVEGRRPEGGRVVHAQIVTDAPDPVFYAVRADLDGTASVRALRLDVERPDGHFGVEVTRTGGAVRAVGSAPGAPRLAVEVPVSPETPLVFASHPLIAVLAGPLVTSTSLVVPRFDGLAVGEKRTLEVETVELDPEFFAAPATWTVERRPDRKAGERAFEVAIHGRNWSDTRTVVIGVDGAIKEATFDAQMAILTAKRKTPRTP